MLHLHEIRSQESRTCPVENGYFLGQLQAGLEEDHLQIKSTPAPEREKQQN